MYLDADIVCIRNPIDELKLAFEQMSLDLKFIGFADELKKANILNHLKDLI